MKTILNYLRFAIFAILVCLLYWGLSLYFFNWYNLSSEFPESLGTPWLWWLLRLSLLLTLGLTLISGVALLIGKLNPYEKAGRNFVLAALIAVWQHRCQLGQRWVSH